MNELIEHLYDAVGHDDALGDALDAMRRQLDAKTLVLVSNRMDGPEPCKHILARGVPGSSLVEYEHHFHRHDVWVNAAVAQGLRAGMVTCGDELVPQDELHASYFWRAFLTRYDTVDALSAIIEFPPQADALTFITFHRGTGRARFGAEEKHLLQQWQPHLATVLRQHRRLAPRLAFGRTLGQVFEDSAQPMVVLSAKGVVKERNSAFDRWQRMSGALVRLDDTGLLHAAVAGEWRSAAQLMASLLQGQETQSRILVSSQDGREVAHLVCHAVEPTFMEPMGSRERSAMAMVEHWEPELRGGSVPAGGPVPGALALARAQERQRIMQDLHDGLGNHLVGLRNMLMKPEVVPGRLAEEVDAALDEMRLLVDALAPEGQELCTVLGMLRYRISPRMEAAGLTLRWDVPATARELLLSPEEVRHVQRIVMEALTNILKHARAQTACIEVRQSDAGTEVAIVDDGCGMPKDAAPRGHGLTNMRRRAQWIGAALILEPGRNAGTVLRLRWPLQNQAAHQGG